MKPNKTIVKNKKVVSKYDTERRIAITKILEYNTKEEYEKAIKKISRILDIDL